MVLIPPKSPATLDPDAMVSVGLTGKRDRRRASPILGQLMKSRNYFVVGFVSRPKSTIQEIQSLQQLRAENKIHEFIEYEWTYHFSDLLGRRCDFNLG